jgi:transposase
VNGLADRQRSGKPRGLSVEERKSVLDLLLIFPQAPRRVLAEFTQRTGKTISRSTLKRLAKEAGLSWKRVRKTTAKPPDKQAVEAARAVLTDFKKTSDRADGLILL